jgi:hypothetical protein
MEGLIVAGAAATGGDSPLGCDPAFDEHALKGRVERAFFDLEDILTLDEVLIFRSLKSPSSTNDSIHKR